jgi:hypothetical protein
MQLTTPHSKRNRVGTSNGLGIRRNLFKVVILRVLMRHTPDRTANESLKRFLLEMWFGVRRYKGGWGRDSDAYDLRLPTAVDACRKQDETWMETVHAVF